MLEVIRRTLPRLTSDIKMTASGLQPAHGSLQHSAPESAGGVPGPVPSPTYSAMAGGDDAIGEVEDSVMSSVDLTAFTNRDHVPHCS